MPRRLKRWVLSLYPAAGKLKKFHFDPCLQKNSFLIDRIRFAYFYRRTAMYANGTISRMLSRNKTVYALHIALLLKKPSMNVVHCFVKMAELYRLQIGKSCPLTRKISQREYISPSLITLLFFLFYEIPPNVSE